MECDVNRYNHSSLHNWRCVQNSFQDVRFQLNLQKKFTQTSQVTGEKIFFFKQLRNVQLKKEYTKIQKPLKWKFQTNA